MARSRDGVAAFSRRVLGLRGSACPGQRFRRGKSDCRMRQQRGELMLDDAQRRRLERRWLVHKLFYGTA